MSNGDARHGGEPDPGCWFWSRCYRCGHRLDVGGTVCPQCDEVFDGRREPTTWPDQCACGSCVAARAVEP
jgi:hypothetical protein